MNNSTKIIIIGSLLSTLGIAGLAKAISTNQPQLPVAIMPQHHSSTQMIISKDKDVKIDENREQPDAAYDADSEVNHDKVPTSLVVCQANFAMLNLDINAPFFGEHLWFENPNKH
ncbi:hypothetical protein [Nostoc punctiforme]|uniref:hypothetical protein n=1 Tax=Nostoc punctiforme TaxID=272131 RepID=UPI000038DBC4|nr:hypothetical protein [Nostoc punctiforme]